MSNHLFGRHCELVLPVAVKGDGAYIHDREGNKYLDCGDAAVSCLGHSNERVTKAIKAQLDKIAFAHTGSFNNEPALELADFLAERAPADINHIYLVSGGSEAVESALKLARQYFVERAKPHKSHVIARLQSYHGNTIGALSSGGNQWRRALFEPILISTSHIPPCYIYRGKKETESEIEYGISMANELEAEIQRIGADKVMAYIVEPVVGATIGAATAAKGYFKRIREICDQYDVLLIFDEVMCGMGRTGTLFAAEQEDVTPDIITVAKGLAAGYQPIGAMMATTKIFNTIKEGSGFFQHGHTFMAHPLAAAAALATQHEIESKGLLQQVRYLGAQLENKLTTRLGAHPNIGDIRGRGLFWGLELVEDKANKTPFNPDLAIHKKIKVAAKDEGLICYPMGGTIDGKNGDHILLAPPFILKDEQVDELVDKLTNAITSVFAQI